MAITSAIANSFKRDLGIGRHNFTVTTGDVFKLALIKAANVRTYGAGSLNYSELIAATTDEVAAGGGYATGGFALVSATPVLSGATAIFDFTSDISNASSTFSTDGCEIYNTSKANEVISVHDFGGTKSPSNGTFAINFPVADASNAYIRLA